MFDVITLASNPQLPFDISPPAGIDGMVGISVEGVFTSPTGKTWEQPAFYYRIFDDQIKDGIGWFYPTGKAVWKIRFSPDEVGTWQYYIKAQDKTGTTQTGSNSFTVTPSTSHGFVRASKTDPRYFEYSDGTYFPALGINSGLDWANPASNQQYFEKTGQNGIQVSSNVADNVVDLRIHMESVVWKQKRLRWVSSKSWNFHQWSFCQANVTNEISVRRQKFLLV